MNLLQITISMVLILLIIPQTPTENIVLRKLNETGLFNNYKQAKDFVNISTWTLIISFLILNILRNIV